MQTDAARLFADLQDRICAALQRIDGNTSFGDDSWSHAEGGGGRTRVLTQGTIFEKAAVNFSEVWGQMRGDLAASLPGQGTEFYATGISLIVHPRSPLVPTVHMNERMLRRGSATWYGGGADLTPYYVFDEDAARFHEALRRACSEFDPSWYPRFKKACDEYFFLRHRNEPRGIGGIFFDYMQLEPTLALKFLETLARSFTEAYTQIVQARQHAQWGERERAWQLARRGRYVEFNLLYDRGTAFGLHTGGRAESILVSLPPLVRWDYAVAPEAGSPEAISLEKIIAQRDWLSEAVPTASAAPAATASPGSVD